MTEFRRDPLSHRWVITGFAQGDKPQDLIPKLKKSSSDQCPFCPGKEYLTPPEVFATRDSGNANEPGWRIRVVPNRSTDLQVIELNKRPQGIVYDLQNASGIHETIIETPDHCTRLSQLSIAQITEILKTFQQRNAEHKKNHVLKSSMIFRNQGEGCAGTNEHAHSQIISVPFVFKTLKDEIFGAKRFFKQKNRCIFCDMRSEEQRMGQRVVYEKGNYLAWCPFAARFPFEVWIVGQTHHAQFLYADAQTFEPLADVIKTVVSKIEKILGNTPISFVLHSAPFRLDDDETASVEEAYHWHIEILPHALPAGGFEWGADFFMSPPTPEVCAKILLEN